MRPSRDELIARMFKDRNAMARLQHALFGEDEDDRPDADVIPLRPEPEEDK